MQLTGIKIFKEIKEADKIKEGRRIKLFCSDKISPVPINSLKMIKSDINILANNLYGCDTIIDFVISDKTDKDLDYKTELYKLFNDIYKCYLEKTKEPKLLRRLTAFLRRITNIFKK